MKKLLFWLPFAITITLLTGMIYFGLQQNYRASANDPQIQTVHDLATKLAEGQRMDTLLSSLPKVEVASSLTTFIIIFDKDQKIIASTGVLDGNMPTPPASVLDSAKNDGENRLTWQPQPDVRLATVIKHYGESDNEGYVLAARSLREVETRIKNLTTGLVIGWAIAMIASFAAVLLYFKFGRS